MTQFSSRMRLSVDEPYKRVGLCCGEKCKKKKKRRDVALYRARKSRYRCIDCFLLEVGYLP